MFHVACLDWFCRMYSLTPGNQRWLFTAEWIQTCISRMKIIVQGDTKKREILKNPTKIEEIQEKKLLIEIEPLQLAF